MKKMHEKNTAKWIAIGLATVTVLLAIAFHEYVFDMLGVAFDMEYWSFWAITWPMGIFVVDNILALWDKGFFTRSESYWRGVCHEFIFVAILHLLSALTPLIMLWVLGVYFSPAMGIQEITTESSVLLKETYPSFFALSLPFTLVMLPLVFGFPAIPSRRSMDGDGAFEWREGELSKDEFIEKNIVRLYHCPSNGDVTMFHPKRLSQIHHTAKQVKAILASEGCECSMQFNFYPDDGWGSLSIKTPSLAVRDMDAFCQATKAADVMEIKSVDEEDIEIWMLYRELFLYLEE